MNPNAIEFLSIKYDAFRRGQVREHNRVYHRYDDAPPLHIPADLEGVAP